MATTYIPKGLEKPWLEFVEIDKSASGKTQQWIVYATAGGQLGTVKWFGRRRCYGFFPGSETVFEKACLRNIADFCDKETNKQREKVRLVSADRQNTRPVRRDSGRSEE